MLRLDWTMVRYFPKRSANHAKLPPSVDSFSIVAITNRHKLSGLKQRTLMTLQFWRRETSTGVLGH